MTKEIVIVVNHRVVFKYSVMGRTWGSQTLKIRSSQQHTKEGK